MDILSSLRIWRWSMTSRRVGQKPPISLRGFPQEASKGHPFSRSVLVGSGHDTRRSRVRDDSPMRTRHGTFVEIFQAPSPIDTESFRILRDEVRASGTPRLREFFVALNRELAARLAAPGSTDLA